MLFFRARICFISKENAIWEYLMFLIPKKTFQFTKKKSNYLKNDTDDIVSILSNNDLNLISIT